MSIDLLHRMNHSEKMFRRGGSVTGEIYVDKGPDEERERELRKRGATSGGGYYDKLIEKLKEP